MPSQGFATRSPRQWLAGFTLACVAGLGAPFAVSEYSLRKSGNSLGHGKKASEDEA